MTARIEKCQPRAIAPLIGRPVKQAIVYDALNISITFSSPFRPNSSICPMFPSWRTDMAGLVGKGVLCRVRSAPNYEAYVYMYIKWLNEPYSPFA